MTDPVDVTVSDNPAKSRYEALVDGEVAGFVEYRIDGDAIDMHHTEVSDAYEGKGVGSRLAKGALDAVRERGLSVIPTCPFIKRYIERQARKSVVSGKRVSVRVDLGGRVFLYKKNKTTRVIHQN